MTLKRIAIYTLVAAGPLLLLTCKPDDVPPQMAMISPTEGETLMVGPVTIKVWALDKESGVDSVEFRIDYKSLAWATSGLDDTFETTWNADSVGPHYVGAAAFDRKDNFNIRGATVYIKR
jgi:hypothetical protein